MARWRQAGAWLVVLALPGAAESKCRFKYAQDFAPRLVVPETTRKLGPDLSLWDIEHPDVSVQRRTVRLLISMRDKARYLDPPYFVILVDHCGKGEVSSGFQAWDVALGLRQPTSEERRRRGWLTR